MSVMVELELVELEQGSEHPFDYFRGDMEEFFEQFGWKLVNASFDEEGDSTNE